MSRTALVTIVVPGFDVAPYARDAIESLRAQTDPRWRAILVDDGSTDETGQIFAAAAAEDDRIEIVSHAERRGLGSARNSGLDLVTTPLLGFLDADDVFTPDALGRLVSTLERTGSDFVAGAYVRLTPSEAGSYSSGEVQPWVAAATAPARDATTIDEHPEASANIVAWSKVSWTSFWTRNALRFPEGRLYEDQVVAQRMYSRARAFDVIADVVVRWRVRPDGSSITQREHDVRVLVDCLQAMRDGIAVLDSAGHRAAARARARQILRMDVPRLAAIAVEHSDPAYRRLLGDFTRDLRARPDARDAELTEPSGPAAAAVAAALLW